jgi:dsRNA-specific ribonuclease
MSITEKDVYSILAKCGINTEHLQIKRMDLYRQALTHASVHPSFNYERLEWFGDTLVRQTVAAHLFKRFPSASPGFYSRLVSELVKKKQLAECARFLALDQYIMLAKDVHLSDSILEDVFEAWVAAVQLDQSEEPSSIRSVLDAYLISTAPSANTLFWEQPYALGTYMASLLVSSCIIQRVDLEDLVLNQCSYKDILLQKHQEQYGVPPTYRSASSESVSGIWEEMVVLFQPPMSGEQQEKEKEEDVMMVLGRGSASRRQDAQQLAAKDALVSHFGFIFDADASA